MLRIVKLVDSIKQHATLCLRVQVRIICFVIHEVFAQSFPYKLKIIVKWFTTNGNFSRGGDSKSVQRW